MTSKVKQFKPLTMSDICSTAVDQELNSAVSEDGKVRLLGRRTESLWRLVQFMELVLKTKDLAFEVTGRDSCRCSIKKISKLADFYQGFHSFYDLYCEDVEYSPDVALFFRRLAIHPVRDCCFNRPGLSYGGDLIDADIFNNFIECLRGDAKVDGTRKKMADWARNPNKNLARVRSYLNALFERYSRLLVVRVDFLYRETILKDDQAVEDAHVALMRESDSATTDFLHGMKLDAPAEPLARVDVGVAKADMEKFLRQMRSNTVFDETVGYIWKMEWSRWGGYHFHCAFFFDGSEVQSDYLLAKGVGEHWEAVTEGRGFSHNCNQDPRKYRNWGIGRVDHYDHQKREMLGKAISYLAKRDQYVRMKPTGKHRSFQTGVIKKKISRAGRPRSKVPLTAIGNRTVLDSEA